MDEQEKRNTHEAEEYPSLKLCYMVDNYEEWESEKSLEPEAVH